MRRSLLQNLSTFWLAVLVVVAFASPRVANAQVPSGVVVDSIAPATDWTNIFPERAHSLVEDPNTGRIAFVAGTGGAGANPVWLSSADNGQTWSSLTGFLPAGDGRVAIAADSNFTCYIAYRHAFAGTNAPIGIYFNKDPNGDGSGLGTPVLVNDTSATDTLGRLGNYPDIAVSPDGQNIIITAMDFVFNTNGGSGATGMCRAYVSHDGGATWTMHAIVNPFDPSVTPAKAKPGMMWYGPSLAMGSNGYAFFIISANYDSTNASSTYWEITTETNDYGNTWSTPSWVTLPPSTEYTPGTAFWMYGTALAVGNTPHFADRMILPGGQQEVVEFHKEAGSWVNHAISQVDPLTGSYAFGELGELGADSQGRIYCFYDDKNISAAPSSYDDRQIFVSGSSDGGDTWTPAVRLTDKEFVVVGDSATPHWPHLLRFPVNVPSTAVGLFINGLTPGLFGAGSPTLDAWGEVSFPLSVVWTGPYDHDLTAPKPGGYQIASKGSAAYSWTEISTIGTKVTGWYNGSYQDSSAERDDGSAGPFPIGFNFGFYGHTYSHFWLGVNGLVSFTDSVLSTGETGTNPKADTGFYSGSYNFPGAGNPFHTVISAFYNDLVLGPAYGGGYGHGDVYYWTNSAMDTCIIEYHNAGDFLGDQTDTTLTFEVVFASKDSSVSIMYKDLGKDNAAASAKVGIQAVDSIGVSYVNGSIPLSDVPQNMTGVKFTNGAVSAVDELPSSVPLTYRVYQNYPNPFNPTTNITYDIPQKANVTVTIYNVLGQEVATLVNGIQSAGHHLATFNGARFASGVYFYRVRAGRFSETMKMIMLK